MRDITRGTVTVDHPHGRVARIRELMKDARRYPHRLTRVDRRSLFTQTHFTRAFHDEVDLLLLLVVPRDLPTIRLESDVTHRKIRRLNRARAPDKVLGTPPRGISASGYLLQIRDDHEAIAT